jgi:hypothetical protein
MEPQKLSYYNPTSNAGARRPSFAIVSLWMFGAAASGIAACTAINVPIPAFAVALFGGMALTAIGELLSLWAAIFGRRHRRLAIVSYFLNAAGLVYLLWPAAHG